MIYLNNVSKPTPNKIIQMLQIQTDKQKNRLKSERKQRNTVENATAGSFSLQD